MHPTQKAQTARASWPHSVEWAGHEIPDQLGANVTDSDGAAARLGQHLLTLYWQGYLPLEPDGLLETFFRRASSWMRARALEFIGFSLHDYYEEKAVMPPDVVERLKLLWEWRVGEAAANTFAAGSLEEFSVFGNGFAFGPFVET